MSTLYYSPFILVPQRAINSKHASESIHGYNLKLSYKDETLYTSYTLHPSLGDPDKEKFLQILKTSTPYVLLENFKEEYKLKTSGRYFLDYMDHELKTHGTIQKNKYTEQDLEIALALYRRGFKRIKFKMNSDFFIEAEFYYNFLDQYQDLEFIFDFNSTGDVQKFLDLKWSKDILQRTFWEDPIVNDLDHLLSLKALGFRLILDQKDMLHHQRVAPFADAFEIVAVKPTKESVAEVMKVFPKSKILVTTNMGDEMDHVISAYWANYIYKQHPDRFFGAGLYTRHFFKSVDLLDELNGKVVELRQTLNWYEENISNEKNQGFYTRSKEIDPKVRTSFFNVSADSMSRGWGLEKEMNRLEWTKLKDLDIEL